MLVHLETFRELQILMNWVFVLISAGAAAYVLGFHCLVTSIMASAVSEDVLHRRPHFNLYKVLRYNTIIISGENEDLQRLDNPSTETCLKDLQKLDNLPKETHLKDCRTGAQIQVIT